MLDKNLAEIKAANLKAEVDELTTKAHALRERLWRVKAILEDSLPLDVEHNIHGHADQLPEMYRRAIQRIELALAESKTPEDLANEERLLDL